MAFLFALMPGLFFPEYVSSSEMRALSQLPADQMQPLLANLTEMRKAIFTADCWRSFWIVVAGTLLLLLFKARKLRGPYMVGAVTVLCLIDMWQVNKRYLYDDMFVEKSVRTAPVQMTDTERLILQDKQLYYRTLNLASNTFNENETSYYLKSVGGYHPAKLRRYQELVEAYISPEMQKLFGAVAASGGDMTQVKGDSIFPVLNMLNAKYFIMPLQSGQTVPVQNPYVYGNAWIVDRVNYVDNANQELDMVGKLSLRHEAVADRKFADVLGQSRPQESTSVVRLTSYDANKLTYDVSTAVGGVVVFSEIFYPGWTATVDGQPVEVGRVNYVLRAISVKPGNHKVELSFFPKTVDTTEAIAYAAYAVLALVVVVLVLLEWRRRKNGGAKGQA